MLGRRPESLLAELNRLESLRDPAKSGQQRQFKRFPVRGDAELHPMSRSRLDRQPLEVQLRDLGRGGVGFICHQPLPTGSSWRIAFLQHGYVVGEQAVLIRHCHAVSDGLYLVGGQFIADTGLLTILGLDPGAVLDGDGADTPDEPPVAGFLPPSEVA